MCGWRALLGEHLVDAQVDFGNQGVERAHRWLHLARLDLRHRDRRTLESQCEVAQADPAFESNLAKAPPHAGQRFGDAGNGHVGARHSDDLTTGMVARALTAPSLSRVGSLVTWCAQTASAHLAVAEGGGHDQEPLKDVLPLLVEAQERGCVEYLNAEAGAHEGADERASSAKQTGAAEHNGGNRR